VVKRREMNGLELEYANHLDLLKLLGVVVDWQFEPLRFRLAEGAWYKPDFGVLYRGEDGGADWIEMHETKGLWREAARVRIKVAADRHPWFRFKAIQWDQAGGVWKVEEFR